MINKLMREEKVKDFLLKAGEVLSGIPVRGKGGSEWRYLHHELKKKRRKSKKPF